MISHDAFNHSHFGSLHEALCAQRSDRSLTVALSMRRQDGLPPQVGSPPAAPMSHRHRGRDGARRSGARRFQGAIHEAEILDPPDVGHHLCEALALVGRHAAGDVEIVGEEPEAKSLGQHEAVD